MRSGSARSALGNPVLVGAITILVVFVAVFLAYNANQGLPFVPTTQLKVLAPNATKLVKGNEVREGGFRIGAVAGLEPARLPSGEAAAEITLQIDQTAAPLPRDTSVAIRPRSALGLRYVEILRGREKRTLPDGSTVKISRRALSPEFEDFFAMFRPQTRRDIQANLTEFGAAFAGRGDDLNATIASLPRLFRDLEPVMKTLSDPQTGLARFIDELEDAARATAPVSRQFAQGFSDAADTFEAVSRDPQALRDTISKSPDTLRVGTESLRAQRPFLRNLAAISPLVRSTAAELRRSLPPVNAALAAGTPALRQTPPFNEDLRKSFVTLRSFSEEPSTGSALRAFTDTVDTLNPMIRYLGPHVTVCNYWNSWWTNLSDHISEQDTTGTIQRIQVKNAPRNQKNTLDSFGAPEPANGEPTDPVDREANGDPVNLHAQAYGRAIDEQGNADCETGQRGYPQRLAKTAPPNYDIAIDPRTPGNQGPTFTGRARVPEGETFTAEPETGFKVTP
ncbi:MAG TPA: MlaD family protein [Solirubrobacteraceae bacterium]|jgi:virulence factor Mce-like protein